MNIILFIVLSPRLSLLFNSRGPNSNTSFLYEITREFIIFVVLYSDNKTYMLILNIVHGSKNGFAPK